MVQYQSVDRTLAALADPRRRAMIERLSQGSASISELAGTLGMTLTGVKKHIRVLEEAALVKTRKVGRVRECELGEERLSDLERWIEAYQQAVERRLDSLQTVLEQQRS
jgi:DNA-binding transcriptional ArsR family regulator